MTIDRFQASSANILIVDDTPTNLRLLSEILGKRGYKVRSVTNGSTALRAAKAKPPDLILLDINMPQMDGYEVCEKLKEDEQTQDIPVIFLSALDEVPDKVKAFSVGGVDYITKPFQLEEVFIRIENQLQLRRAQQLLAEQNDRLEQEVRDRMRAEEELRRSQQFLDSIIEHLPLALYTKDVQNEYRYVLWNRACEKMFGISSEQAISHNVRDLYPPETAEIFESQQREVVEKKELQEIPEEEVESAHGNKILLRTLQVPLLDGDGNVTHLMCIAENITERIEATRALSRSNAILKAQQEAALDGILVLDENRNIASYNQRFCELWNIPPHVIASGDTERLLSWILWPMDNPQEFLEQMNYLSKHRTQVTRDEITFKDGRVFDRYSGPVRSSSGQYYGRIWYFRDVSDRKRTEAALRLAQQKSDRLLLNILPQKIADRLKQAQGSVAEQFEDATIMFADLVDFTPLSARLLPIDLVNLLNQIFSAFDKLTDRYQLEKIKTIGDAYMVAGGLPTPREDHAEAIADMALEMLNIVQQYHRDDGKPFQIRIGIHTGPVVAGVIGTKKFIYDLWGDTVNVASRMESQGEAEGIQVTEAMRQRLQEKYLFQPRGAIDVKGRGWMNTFWLTGKR
ncbi:adenylate/guanylate cyclase domain-containing protein [Geitlerinema sp. PCC 9228]|uniref:adenylate/guanylate cyclase domain-containing protein n=1 Tax=Geitlerinema sp. PCC 9228 TaxID=111611 RepID=UPI0008F9DFDB|nr:adenylate/guanylate cyclase domain-containing protein [Geitlerinema sp. PCC 9228]